MCDKERNPHFYIKMDNFVERAGISEQAAQPKPKEHSNGKGNGKSNWRGSRKGKPRSNSATREDGSHIQSGRGSQGGRGAQGG